MGSLGCYKGVMLCNRPPEEPSRQQSGGAGGQPPFLGAISTTARDQVGLPPAKDGKKIEPTRDVKRCGPSAALRRHCQWIKELQEQVREDQKQCEDSAKAQEERKQRMQETFKRQRDAIRLIKKERDTEGIDPYEIEAIMQPKRGSQAPEGARKPMWAMTEAEKEGFEDEEADDLIRFAENIDFDRYITDLEFRQGLQAVRDRAKRLQREQDAFKDSILREFNAPASDEEEEGRSTSADGEFKLGDGASRAFARKSAKDGPGDRPDWDASTACGEERLPDRQAMAAADRVLEANPQLRAVHSKGSIQRLIDRASQQGSVPPSEA